MKIYTCSEQPGRKFRIVETIGERDSKQVMLEDIKIKSRYGYVGMETLKEVKNAK